MTTDRHGAEREYHLSDVSPPIVRDEAAARYGAWRDLLPHAAAHPPVHGAGHRRGYDARTEPASPVTAVTTGPTPTAVHLVCDNCRLDLMLGHSIVRRDGSIRPVTLYGRPAWDTAALNTAIWRLVTDHTGHYLLALTRSSARYARYATGPGYRILPTRRTRSELGDPEISYAEYIDGWPHTPARHRGSTPRPVDSPPAGTASVCLICVPCRLELVLGDTTTRPDGTLGAITVDGWPGDHDQPATLALWRLFTEHPDHDLLAVAADTPAHDYYRSTGERPHTVRRRLQHPPADGWPLVPDDEMTHTTYTAGWPHHHDRSPPDI